MPSRASKLAKALLDSGAIFVPQAWDAAAAYAFLQDAPLLENAGLQVRLPDWWAARPKVRATATVGTNAASSLGLDALMSFDIGAALGDESLTEAEIKTLLAGRSGLVQFKGKWIEVDPAKLQQALDHLGKAWCKHIESWQDNENRLPRGRSYVRSGAVVDLRLAAGEITAKVQGSSLYKINIAVTQLPAPRWKAFKQLSLGKVGSLLGLMQGKLPEELLQELTNPESGLFPRKKEMKLHCNCPDYSSLCKHLAAVLYGVGNRLDTQPELLFTLRGVDHTELLSQAAGAAADLGTAALGDSALGDDDLGAIFGIELATPAANTPSKKAPAKKAPAKKAPAKKAPAKNRTP